MAELMNKYTSEYQHAGNLAPKNPPSEVRDSDSDFHTSQVQLLPIYLREMGQTPLLDRDDEVRLARELQDPREKL